GAYLINPLSPGWGEGQGEGTLGSTRSLRSPYPSPQPSPRSHGARESAFGEEFKYAAGHEFRLIFGDEMTRVRHQIHAASAVQQSREMSLQRRFEFCDAFTKCCSEVARVIAGTREAAKIVKHHLVSRGRRTGRHPPSSRSESR